MTQQMPQARSISDVQREDGDGLPPKEPLVVRDHAALNWPAIISLASGLAALVGLGPVGSVFAIVLGHIGVKHAQRIDAGHDQADWGLILGYGSLLLWGILLVILTRNVAVVLEWWQQLVLGVS